MTDRPDPFADVERLVEQLTGVEEERDVPIDLIDEGQRFVVVADLPGFAVEDVDVQLSGEQELRLSAERETETAKREGDYVRRERQRQSVSRTVSLPGLVDPEATEAEYGDGVVTVRLPKQTGGDAGTEIPVE